MSNFSVTSDHEPPADETAEQTELRLLRAATRNNYTVLVRDVPEFAGGPVIQFFETRELDDALDAGWRYPYSDEVA